MDDRDYESWRAEKRHEESLRAAEAQMQAAEEAKRASEEARWATERQNDILRRQEKQKALENSRPNCKYCGQKFWTEESEWYAYCSPKCANDDLGREGAFRYRQEIDDDIKGNSLNISRKFKATNRLLNNTSE